MSKFYDLVRVNTVTSGTGQITLGTAVSGFLTFLGAGVPDGETVTYAISDGANSEIGWGVVGGSGTTLTRSVLKSTNSNNPISLSGSAVVFITLAAEDLAERSVRPTNVNMTRHGNVARLVCSPGEFIIRDQPLAQWFHGDVKIDGGLAVGGPVDFSYENSGGTGADTYGSNSYVIQKDYIQIIDYGTIFLPKAPAGRMCVIRMNNQVGTAITQTASAVGIAGFQGSAGNGGGGTASQVGGAGSGFLIMYDTTLGTVTTKNLGTGTGSLAITFAGYVHMYCGGCGGNATTSSGGAGGGGAFAASNEILVKPGDTIFWSIGASNAAAASWVNLNANSAPVASTTGVKADFGRNGVTTTAGAAGSVANSIGTTTKAGAIGATLTGGIGAGCNGTSTSQPAMSIRAVPGSTMIGSNITNPGSTTGTSLCQLIGGLGLIWFWSLGKQGWINPNAFSNGA